MSAPSTSTYLSHWKRPPGRSKAAYRDDRKATVTVTDHADLEQAIHEADSAHSPKGWTWTEDTWTWTFDPWQARAITREFLVEKLTAAKLALTRGTAQALLASAAATDEADTLADRLPALRATLDSCQHDVDNYEQPAAPWDASWRLTRGGKPATKQTFRTADRARHYAEIRLHRSTGPVRGPKPRGGGTGATATLPDVRVTCRERKQAVDTAQALGMSYSAFARAAHTLLAEMVEADILTVNADGVLEVGAT